MVALCDAYKISHRKQYPVGTEKVYSTWTPRASRIEGIDHVVVAGWQRFLQKYLIEKFNNEFFNRPLNNIVNEYREFMAGFFGDQNAETDHIEYLHGLGYLPLEIWALPEGSVVPLRVPMLTITNTDPKCFWLTNFIETLMSCELWQSSTSATLAHEYRKVLDFYAEKTSDNTWFVDWQGHDFSMRGMGGVESAILSGIGHLMSFSGTDTIPAYLEVKKLYGECVGGSVPATEHSVASAYGNDMDYFNAIIDTYPTGIVSVVSDTWDFWSVLTDILPQYKERIMARDGKIVIRPDTGIPELIICGDPDGKTEAERKGAIEVLWDLFGGVVNSKGYRELDSHIGLIYGDAITLERTKEICRRLKEKGFASTNVVLGIGSFTYQFNTRDTFGFALKSTMCVVDGHEKFIFKDPKTDIGSIKKSQKGCVAVINNNGEYIFEDQLTYTNACNKTEMMRVFKDGQILHNESWDSIKKRLKRHV